MLEHTTIARCDIGTVIGRRASWCGKRVVVALVHSLGIGYLPQEFFDYFGQVWFDECHASVPPKTFAPTAAAFPARYRGAASATPYRPDGMHRIIEAHIIETTLCVEDSNRMAPTALFLRHKRPRGLRGVPGGIDAKKRRGMIISALAGDPSRNMLLADYITRIYNSDRRQVVLSDRTEQLQVLRDILHKTYAIAYKDMGFYCRGVGGKKISNHELKRVASGCKIILATYGMMKMGTDIKDLAGLVYATPQADPRQSKGRIERVLEGKKKPVIVDVWDLPFVDVVRWARKRWEFYREDEMEVKFI